MGCRLDMSADARGPISLVGRQSLESGLRAENGESGRQKPSEPGLPIWR